MAFLQKELLLQWSAHWILVNKISAAGFPFSWGEVPPTASTATLLSLPAWAPTAWLEVLTRGRGCVRLPRPTLLLGRLDCGARPAVATSTGHPLSGSEGLFLAGRSRATETSGSVDRLCERRVHLPRPISRCDIKQCSSSSAQAKTWRRHGLRTSSQQ